MHPQSPVAFLHPLPLFNSFAPSALHLNHNYLPQRTSRPRPRSSIRANLETHNESLLKPPPSHLPESSTSIVWFRNDLRVRDHAALALAATAAEMIPMYIFDTSKFGLDNPSPHGFQRSGPFRTTFLSESVKDLRSCLRKKGSDMIIRIGNPIESLIEIAEGLLQDGVPLSIVAHKEITSEEIEDEIALEREISLLADRSGKQIDVHWVWGSTLHHLEDVPFDPMQFPASIQEYRDLVEGSVDVRAEIDMPPRFPIFPLNRFQSMGLPSLQFDLEVEGLADPLDYAFPCHLASMHFEGGQTTGEERMKEYIFYLKGLEDFKTSRYESGKRNSSSKLSPWMAVGCISPRTVYWDCMKFAKQSGKSELSQAMIDELFMRDFFRWTAISAGTQLFALNGFSSGEESIWDMPDDVEDEVHAERFEKWMVGQTGSPLVDANMRELVDTGFMSIHGRRNAASFLVNDLGYPDWRAGAEYFESLLIDYDVASNWGNWAFMAGVTRDSTDGMKLNVVEESSKYDEEGWFLTRWLPELVDVPPPMIHEPHRLSEYELEDMEIEKGVTYPLPIVPLPEFVKEKEEGENDVPEEIAKFLDAQSGNEDKSTNSVAK